MKRLMKVLPALLLVASLPLLAGAEWTSVKSPNFELMTTAGSGDARRTLQYFEQVRDFFIRIRPAMVQPRLPVTIVVFRNDKEFRPYAPSEAAAAFYSGDQARDFIVMSGTGTDHYPAAVHEYMHLLLKHMELKLPAWLDEGIADVYSTLQPYGGKIAIGIPPRGRALSLSHEKWLPLRTVLAVGHDSPEYNERNRASIFYAQSWMLVHMLSLDPRYQLEFPKFLGAIHEGASGEEAFQKIYGASIEDIDKDLQRYFRSDSLKAALFDTKLQKFDGFEPGPAEQFTVDLALARIQAATGRSAEATALLEKMAKAHPDRWEVWDTLGNVALRSGNIDGARGYLRKAIDLDPPGWQVWWSYARLSVGAKPDEEKVLAALRKTLRLNGTNTEARLALGYQYFSMGRFAESLETYKTIRSVTPDRAPKLFLGRAWAAMRLDKFDEARTDAETARKYAKEPGDIDSVKKMIDYLDHRQAAGASQGPPALADNSEILSSVRGILKQIDCMTTKARLQIEVGGKLVHLLVNDPGAIKIRNQPGGSIDFICGAQPAPKPVVVEYIDRADAETETSGEVRVLEFTSK
jgi:tetratricopeptide (TPR) repeat protein